MTHFSTSFSDSCRVNRPNEGLNFLPRRSNSKAKGAKNQRGEFKSATVIRIPEWMLSDQEVQRERGDHCRWMSSLCETGDPICQVVDGSEIADFKVPSLADLRGLLVDGDDVFRSKGSQLPVARCFPIGIGHSSDSHLGLNETKKVDR